MRGGSRERFVNGVVSALIVCFFLVHGTLGAISVLTGFTSPLACLVWVGVALVAVHVVLCVVTSRQQLTDEERPPSARKVRHLALKWATGALLALAVGLHIAFTGEGAVESRSAGLLAIVVVAAALAVHLCVGSKSLLKDIGVDRRYKTAFRIVAIAFAVVFASSALLALFA